MSKSLSAADRDLLPSMPPHVASEFLLWLAYNEAMGDNEYTLEYEGDLHKEVEISVGEDVELKKPEEEKASVVLRNLEGTSHPELLASLRAGRVVHRAKLLVRTGDREYGLTLAGPQLTWSGVKLPKLVSGKGDDLAEILHEELFLYEDLHDVVRRVFAQYAERWVDPDRRLQEGNSIRTWLGEAFARVFAFDPITGQGRLFG